MNDFLKSELVEVVDRLKPNQRRRYKRLWDCVQQEVVLVSLGSMTSRPEVRTAAAIQAWFKEARLFSVQGEQRRAGLSVRLPEASCVHRRLRSETQKHFQLSVTSQKLKLVCGFSSFKCQQDLRHHCRVKGHTFLLVWSPKSSKLS